MPSINREQFLAILESCRPGLAQKEIIDQSRCFVFFDGLIYSYNDEVACHIASPFGKDFVGAVHHEKLLNCLNKLQEEMVDVSVKDNELLVKGKNKCGHFRMEAKIAMPLEVIEKPKDDQWQTLPERFGEAVGLVQKCAGMDDNKFSMTCVHITPNYVEAGDYYQICRWDMQTGFAKDLLVRRNAIKHVKDMGANQFAETERWVHFKNPRGLILSCRRYVDNVVEFPDFNTGLSVTGKPLSLPKALKETADRAKDFIGAQGSDHDELYIDLKPGPGGKGAIRITGRDGIDWYEEVKRVEYTGDEMHFMLPPAVLQEVVEKHSNCEVTEEALIVKGSNYKYITGLTKKKEESKSPSSTSNGSAREEYEKDE
jgi:hypothetical protein